MKEKNAYFGFFFQDFRGENNQSFNTLTTNTGTSLAVWWLRLCSSKVGGAHWIPRQGAKISHVARPKKKKLINTYTKLHAEEQLLKIRLKAPNPFNTG